jgi:hypothetical protein
MENQKTNLYHLFHKAGKTMLLFLFSISIINIGKAQSPQPGDWIPSGTGTSTTTTHAVGVGVTMPVGWQEVQYCDDSENGLVITKNACPLSPNQIYPLSFDGRIEPVLTEIGTPSFVPYPTPDFTLRAFGSNSNANPMLWARTENNQAFTGITSGNYTSRFIVTPTGNAGVNIEAPRATFDIKSLGGYNYPGLLIGRQRLGSPSKTRHIMFIPLLHDDGYNSISKRYDQGLFFTDGNGTSGENLNGAFVIAPWSDPTNSNVGGLRIDKFGNLEVHGTTRTTKLTVNAKWWSDFVFDEDYKLMGLTELEKYIKLNKHLPGVPCEKEVLKNGLDVAEMQAIQQQKIEELTLYIISLEKKMKEMSKTIKALID